VISGLLKEQAAAELGISEVAELKVARWMPRHRSEYTCSSAKAIMAVVDVVDDQRRLESS
jgi:hypothetical protein